jgi:DNA-3-methyladenine glycosylase II
MKTSDLSCSTESDGGRIAPAVSVAAFAKAQRHLSRRDRVLQRLIRTIGPCTLRHNPDRFLSLVNSIISQQISTKAAASIRARLAQVVRAGRVTPANLLRTPEATLRAAGLSAAKTRYLLDLARHVHKEMIPLADLHEFPDEEVIARLIPVKGIGPWTAQMFLIFSLGRTDVLPVDDLGLRVGVQRQYGLKEPPGRAQLAELAEPWRPYRSIATWYFWRSLGNVPQSGNGPDEPGRRPTKARPRKIS